ncbi:uncharacterized protein LOC132612771 [Lycium barbarum]|uniref:uncharacterized protein LOC132612771 n=1 Tax=Lycium barbarum TaxID=112863 RepID=UPI00293E0091|nr:uncharacterized protein LOC132612771 [Lycium barbarum]
MSNKEALSPSISEVNPSYYSPKKLTSTNPQPSSSSPTVSLPKESNPKTSSPKPVGYSRTRKSQTPKKFVPTSPSSKKPNSEGRTHTMTTSQNLKASVETIEKEDGIEVTSQGVETETAIERGNLREVPPDSGNPTSLANVDISGDLGKSVSSLGHTVVNEGSGPSKISSASKLVSTIAVPWKEPTPERKASSEDEPGSSNRSERVNSEGNEINSDDAVILRTISR